MNNFAITNPPANGHVVYNARVLLDMMDTISTVYVNDCEMPPATGSSNNRIANVTGISRGTVESAETGVMLYPNPAKDRLHFRSIEEGIYRIKVYDAQGRLVMLNENTGIADLDFMGVENGLYLVEINKDEKLISVQRISISK